ncbi:uncharacterized protein LAJ45_04170 [Morchella importuna]|uniref:uncharacterized protein n=1 Tax=Morchella importuna TaxID=1174673 RepID=UPI001E8EF358|nr:uncharacterized protein LAJ45_04170 [Morchella importuna]KAH8151549.1 hypothetical protein LAJ45_04170 [Morchella importuna]
MLNSHSHNMDITPTTPLLSPYSKGHASVPFLSRRDDGFLLSYVPGGNAMHHFLQMLRRYCQNLDYYMARWFRLINTSPFPFDYIRYMQQILLPRLKVLTETFEIATVNFNTREVMQTMDMERWLKMVRTDVEWFRNEGLVKNKGERSDMIQLGICVECGMHWEGMGN